MAYLLVIIICVLLSAFFSSSETALLRIRKEHLEKAIKEAKGPTAFAVRDLVDNTSRLLVTILLGNNVVNIVATAAASALAIHYLGEERGVVVSAICMTFIILVFAEVLPKAVGARSPLWVSQVVGLPLYLIHKALRPIHWLFDRGLEPLIHCIAGNKEEAIDTLEEILTIAKSAEGPHPSGPLSIISSTAGATEMQVKDIMTPRPKIFAFPIKTNASELLDRLIEERYTRIPIYLKSLDKVLGIVHLKDLIKLVRENQDDLRKILKPVIKVPETKAILPLLSEMQRSLIHMAIVKDEFGVTQGLVTSEDILEQIVGEIRDEFDTEELKHLKKLPGDGYEAEGTMYVSDFNRDTGWEVPGERGETLSGVVLNALGRIPDSTEHTMVGDYLFTILEISGTHISRVRVEKKLDQDKDPQESAGN